MSNQFWSNFFRKDLNLSGRWWHRLFLVIFFVCFAWVLYGMSSYLFVGDHPNIPQWKIVSSIEERITPEVKQIRDLKKVGERVEQKDRSYVLNLSPEDSLYDGFYCSTDLANKISDIQSKVGITNLFLSRVDTPIETFVNYVRENNVKCLIPDAYSSWNMKVTFLEPFGPDSIYGKDLVFYQKSNLLTAFYVLKMFLLVLAIFIGIAVAYYKVFLYIIFGRNKNGRDRS